MQTPPRPPKRDRSIFSEGPKQYVSEYTAMSVPSKMARKELEQNTSNTEQCNAVLTNPADKSNCWICGEALDFSKKVFPFQPQCDHVLPITQADLFLDLYNKSQPERITDAMRMEYAWAHSICNNKKSNQTFLDKTDPNNLKIDKVKIRSVLNEILKTFPTMNIQTRIAAIETKMQPIIAFINQRGAFLSMLATVASKKGGNIQMQSLFQKALDTAKQQGSTMFVETLKNNEPLIESQVVNALTSMDPTSRAAIIDHLTTLASNVRAKFSPARMTAGRRLKRTIKHKTRRRH
jgi:hypothetical protein